MIPGITDFLFSFTVIKLPDSEIYIGMPRDTPETGAIRNVSGLTMRLRR
jgi:hypothetical protein